MKPNPTNKLARIACDACRCIDVSPWLYTTLDRRGQMRLPKDQPQPFSPQPGNDLIGLIEPGGDQQGIGGALLEPHHDFTLSDRYFCRGVDQVPEEMAGLGDLVTVTDANCQQAIQAA